MQGLVTKERKNFDPMAVPFARDPGEIEGLREGASLLEVVSLRGLHLYSLPEKAERFYRESNHFARTNYLLDLYFCINKI